MTKSFNPLSPLISTVSVMDRYIGTELVAPFLFGMGFFSSIGVTIGSLFDLMRRTVDVGLPASLVLKVLLLSLPQFMAYAFPASVLLAALLTYSRLSADSELVALRSCGVSIYRLVLPAIVLSFVVTGIAFTFNEYVVPAANYQAKVSLDKALNKEKPSFQERNIFYPEYTKVKLPNGQREQVLKRLFYAEKFDGQKMEGLTILDWSQEGLNQIVTSQSAAWNPGQNTWDFFKGTIYLISPDASYRNILKFEHQQLQLPRTALDLANSGRDYGEMNLAQARERLKLERLSGNQQKIRKLLIRIHQKIALPFACVVFGIVGAALANRPTRTSKATGFGISVIVIFAYYLLMSVGDALGLSNFLSPVIAAWLPNLFGLGAGAWFLLRAAR
ncbi:MULTISPECIES: LptF/LptG family permease [unclassified Coleofasciculus]|uniref:LptF/LptG family permease n=1 Tax=Cyanophyceae TaxID=3028117 RepID=UPI001F554191|nr:MULTISPECIES: LptF/LptG family permease [unclassified Coleofasciculus]